jgi:hypothetical protein
VERNGYGVEEKASSLFSFAFAFDDHDFVQGCEVFFDLFLRFSFLSSSAEALTFGHGFHISSFLLFSHIKYTFKLQPSNCSLAPEKEVCR